MHLSEFRDFVSNLAVVTTILQFLSGMLVCKQYVANKTTAEASPLPFTCATLSACLWLLYGLAKHDDKIVFVNTIGIALMLSYLIVFYIYTFKKSTVVKQVSSTVLFMVIVLSYVSTAEDNELLLSILGILACTLTLLTIAAPMSKLFYVLRVKSTECLPFPMILMSFFVSSLWFLYGFIEKDIFLAVPNLIGVALAISQLSLFVIYPNTPSSPSMFKSIQA